MKGGEHVSFDLKRGNSRTKVGVTHLGAFFSQVRLWLKKVEMMGLRNKLLKNTRLE